MSELEKAKQEVEQVCFAYDKAGDTGDIKDWKEYYDLENKLIEKVKIANQPQLTIPKNIADELDKIPNEAKRYVQENGFDDYSILDDFVELREFYEADEDETFPGFTGLKEFVKDNLNLCALYLAGKALGVDLVKVGEG